MSTLYIVPLFSSYEVIPNAYTRLIGGRCYILRLCERLLHMDGEICIITDILEISDLFYDKRVTVEVVDIEDFKYVSNLLIYITDSKEVKEIAVINPNVPMLNIETVKNAETEMKVLQTKSYYCSLSSGDSQSFLAIKDFMLHCPFMFIEKNFSTGNGRFYSNFFVPKDQSFIIKNINDWILADRLLKRKRVIFRADGYNELGMGHIYNCITLAYSMFEHEVLMVLTERSKEGIQKVKEAHLPYKVIHGNKDILQLIDEFMPDIWVNDCLDTDKEYIKFLKSKVRRVITIEDLGTGTNEADAVINALYDKNMLSGSNVYSGWEYVCLREEFQIETRTAFSDKVRRILVMFGGTDPSNYNRILYPIIEEISGQYPDIEFDFVVGLGYDAEANGLHTIEEKRIYVYPNVQRVSKYMKRADIAITSQGRTIFELASMGVPSIVLSQNERETKHSFAQMENGFLNLGTFKDVDCHILKNTLDWLINTPKVRKNMYDLMKKYPLRSGLKRVQDIILGY